MFCEWGRRQLICLNSDTSKAADGSEYLLNYLARHFDDASATAEDYMLLVEEAWFRAWLAFEGGYRGFSRDVQHARQAVLRLKEVAL